MSEKESFKEIINADTPVLVDFYADWCGPCHTLAPILKEIASEMGEKIRILKIDVDRNQAVASTFKISGIPTMLMFRKGKMIWRASGVMPKKRIIEQIEQAMLV